jgi:hypothetical protein
MKNDQKKLPKKRNPFVQHLMNRRGGGIHQKSKKSIRQFEKMQLKKEYLGKGAVKSYFAKIFFIDK